MTVLMCWCVDDCDELCVGVDDCVDVLMCWCVDVLMIVLLCWCVDVLMCWWVDRMSWYVDVLMCWCVDELICWWLCWCVDVLMYWCVDCVDVLTIGLMYWCVDDIVLMCWLLCWCVDVLMCWCVDVLMCCVDVLMSRQEKKNRSFILRVVTELWVLAEKKSNFALSDIIFDALSKNKIFMSPTHPQGCVRGGKCLRRNHPPLPLGGLELSKFDKK